MKRIFMAACSLAILAACNSGDSKSGAKEMETPKANSLSDNPDYQKGLELLTKNDCGTCHKVGETSLGPAYADIAVKYASEGEAVVPKLAEKVIKGGSGVWGPGIMTPHAALSQADAEALVKYILLLKK